MDIRYDLEKINPNRWLKEKKRELGLRAAHRLLAMSGNNDPFNKGTEGDFVKAEWFRAVHERFGYPGIHLRRLHYRVVHSEETLTLWDGETEYLNIERHWEKLQEASTPARILRLVDADDFTERRNKAVPSIHQEGSGKPEEPEYWITPPSYSTVLPMALGASSLPKVLGTSDYSRPEYGVTGYDYSHDMQPNVVEIWSEKSGDDAILYWLAGKYGVNYVPGLGFASLTAIKTMLGRLEASGKPGVVLYVSDFDPAGQAMPISVARHCQFACWELEELADEVAPSIRVDNVAVTREQITSLRVPRIPIKEDDPRKARFELAYGEGAVEVDALEAIHPGKLEEFLVERIEELRDPGLEDTVADAHAEARRAVRDAINEVQESHRPELEDLADRAREIEERYSALYSALGEEVAERYNRLEARFDRHVAPLREELETAEAEMRQGLEDLEVDLPELPEGEAPADGDGRTWLFDSERDFVDQTNHFRRMQGKE